MSLPNQAGIIRMAAIITLLVTLVLSLFVQRIGATALTMTGLSMEAAKFQARSAFCGVGFTTEEAGLITNHPVRRRIVYTLMLLGNIGLATVTASTIASLLQANAEPDPWLQLYRLGFLAGGVLLLWAISVNKWVERQHNKIVSWGLRTFTKLEVRDYVSIMNLEEGYSVIEFVIDPDDWLTGKTLRDLNLTKEGILILGIRRQDGTFIGAPRADCKTAQGDLLVLYGPTNRIEELEHRKADRSGDAAHQAAIREHNVEKQYQTVIDPVEQLDQQAS